MTRPAKPEPDYDLVAAAPTAACPRCGKPVTVEPAFVATVRGACRHYAGHCELIGGKPFVAFRRAKRGAPAHA